MNRIIRQYLRDLVIAFFTVLAFLIIQGEVDRRATNSLVNNAYKRGVEVGIMVSRADIPGSSAARVIDACKGSAPLEAKKSAALQVALNSPATSAEGD